ncbi:sugar-binding domain-containing protein [Bifidobacterium oedipodis]|uniref:Glycoside hydrolase family 2 n=1 Tax=Bifidobacterium oedipodis TaxID=2675322 RepID=A0A7Y0HR76_9BIFI|nr:sugar-binding domain-containing protein [Bifidobacterium sp. DSM 109957]NMM93720.1 glycoside hydrolase family 2 [Bifidobacterium sp. DSM 109957]
MRTVTELMDSWEFSSGERPAPAGEGTAINLPHDWAINRPMVNPMDWGVDQAFRDWWGIGWYRRTLTIGELAEGHRFYLDFDGVYENSTVTVNGVEVGGQAYGYSPFRLDITNALKAGDNEILIRVENLDAPTDRWYSGAGIYRTVKLIEVPERHLDERDVLVSQQVDFAAQAATLTISMDSEDRPTVGEIAVTLCDAEDNVVGEVRGDAASGLTLQVADVHLWSAEDPYLYTLNVALPDGSDAIEQRIGLRDVKLDPDRGMLINGVRTVFRGVCLHQDMGCVGSAAKKELIRARLEELKAIGCNGLRLAHHVHPREMLDLADELGFYVYSEPFDKWQSGHYKRYFEAGWCYDLAAMIRRDRNRPSVVMWGVGNEVENQAKRSMLAILRQLVDEAHRLDPTGRPVGCAMSPHFQSEAADTSSSEGIIQATDEALADHEIEDPAERVERIKLIADITDVTVLNYSEQWYDRVHAMIPDKPIFGSEVYQWFVGHDLQMQDYISENPNLVPEEKEWVVGGTIWAGFDYLGESMGWPSKGWSGALVRTNGVPKAGYWLMKSYWQADGEPFVHFMVADYSQPDENVKEHWDIPPFVGHWHFPQFQRGVMPYMVATNCDEIRILHPYRELFCKPVREYPNRVVTGYLPWHPGTLTVIGYRDGKEVCREEIVTPVSPAVSLQFADIAALGRPALPEVVDVPAERGYEQLFCVQCLDTDGNPVFRESTSVRFRVEGPAEIVAVDNGNLMGNEPYGGDAIHMYQGVASVMLRFTGEAGRVVLSADAAGMQSASQTIVVR